jgi:hypothetical protein
LLAVAFGGLALAGCADPYQYSYYNPPPLAAPPVSRYVPPAYQPAPYPFSPYAAPPDDAATGRMPPAGYDDQAPREPPPTDTGEYETPPALLRPLPSASDLQPPAGTPTAGVAADEAAPPPAAAAPPAPSDNSGNVPMMGFRPMRGQRAPGA